MNKEQKNSNLEKKLSIEPTLETKNFPGHSSPPPPPPKKSLDKSDYNAHEKNK